MFEIRAKQMLPPERSDNHTDDTVTSASDGCAWWSDESKAEKGGGIVLVLVLSVVGEAVFNLELLVRTSVNRVRWPPTTLGLARPLQFPMAQALMDSQFAQRSKQATI